MLLWPMLPATAAAGTTSVEPAACSRVSVQSTSVSPGAVAPGAEGPGKLLPYTGQHVAGLCSQAVAKCEWTAFASACGMVLCALLFVCTCMQYCCVKCSCSVDIMHNVGECQLHEHRTGDSSYVPCSGTLLLYAMLKLLHDVISFDLLLPSVKLDMTTLCADVAYCMCVDEHEVGNNPSCIVKGTWLSAELQTWSSLVKHTTKYQVHVFNAGAPFRLHCRSLPTCSANDVQGWT